MPSYWAFAALLVPTGAAALVFSVANNTFVQLGVDPQMRGRVMALYFMCFLGGTPVGAPVIGWIGEHLGAPWSLVIGGAVVVVAGVITLVWLPRLGLGDQASERVHRSGTSVEAAQAAA
jgi:MFS family permease